METWEYLASTRAEVLDRWWATTPYSVLLATGDRFDVIEVPARLGLPALRRGRRGPVAGTPDGRWMFLVRAGQSLRPELARRMDVVLHGYGSWVPAPPTRTPHGRVRWEAHPSATDWRLPDPYEVQELLLGTDSTAGGNSGDSDGRTVTARPDVDRAA